MDGESEATDLEKRKKEERKSCSLSRRRRRSSLSPSSSSRTTKAATTPLRMSFYCFLLSYTMCLLLFYSINSSVIKDKMNLLNKISVCRYIVVIIIFYKSLRRPSWKGRLASECERCALPLSLSLSTLKQNIRGQKFIFTVVSI